MDSYNQRAEGLWNDYLEFEKTFFDKYEGVQNEYDQNIASMPKISMNLPGAISGMSVPLAPRAHTAMYGDIASTKNNLINNQASTQFSSMGQLQGLNNNMLGANFAQAGIDFMPTESALDLYKMERAAQLGLDYADAQKPSTLSTWAPVVGSLLSSSGNGQTNLESITDFFGGLFG